MAVVGRATFTGVLRWGLISAPVKVVKATESADAEIALHMQHKGCGGAVGRPNTCKGCNTQVPQQDVVKAVNGVVVDEALLDSFKVPSDKVVDITSVTPLSALDRRLFDSPRYIVPDKGGADALRGIADALAGEDAALIGKVAEREHEKVVAVYVLDGALVMHDLRWPEEVRDSAPYSEAIEAGKPLPVAHAKMVRKMLAAESKPFDPTLYSDEKGRMRADALRAIAAGATPTPPSAPTTPPTQTDLLAAIEASIRAAEARVAA